MSYLSRTMSDSEKAQTAEHFVKTIEELDKKRKDVDYYFFRHKDMFFGTKESNSPYEGSIDQIISKVMDNVRPGIKVTMHYGGIILLGDTLNRKNSLKLSFISGGFLFLIYGALFLSMMGVFLGVLFLIEPPSYYLYGLIIPFIPIWMYIHNIWESWMMKKYGFKNYDGAVKRAVEKITSLAVEFFTENKINPSKYPLELRFSDYDKITNYRKVQRFPFKKRVVAHIKV